jgi:hypothetical protein
VAGRVNLVDAAAAVIILLLIPVAYGAYVLFRTPPPKLVSVSPVRLFEGHNQQVVIEGTNLRPFMRVSLGALPAKSFLIGSTKYAFINLPDLTPGTYDVVLYDYQQEVDRLPKALTVVPMATDVELEVTGSFKSPSDALVSHLKSGALLPPAGTAIAQVIAVGVPSAATLRLRAGDDTIRVPLNQRELPATLRVKCYSARRPDGTLQCLVPGLNESTVVAADAVLTLSTADGWVSFQIEAVRAPEAAAKPPAER